jgi:hypothetical protein
MAEKIKCTACGEMRDLGKDFYSSYSPFHKSTGKLHVCKQCVTNSMNKEDINSVLNTLRRLDKPFIVNLWESAIKKPNYVGAYFILVNTKDFKNMNWSDSELNNANVPSIEPKDILVSTSSSINQEITEDETEYLIRFWGDGLDLKSYTWLQTEYEDWTNRYECDSKSMETLIQEICLTKFDIKNRRAKGEKVDQQLKTLQELLGSSNLKPVQETGANAVEQESFGTLIKKFEREKPIPEPDPIWKDVDGIGKYIRTFFFGHMAKAIGAENKFQDEYDEEVNKHTISQDDYDGDE